MKPKWAVCYHSFGAPSTWGRILRMDETSCEVIYGEDAPIWSSNLWKNNYVKVFDTEDEAKEVVEKFIRTYN